MKHNVYLRYVIVIIAAGIAIYLGACRKNPVTPIINNNPTSFDDPNYNNYKDIADLPPHIVEEMIHFFSVYKELEQKSTAVDEFGDANAAREIIRADIERYIECFCK